MAEIHEPGVLQTPKPRRKLKISDIIAFAVLAIIIIVLAATLISKLQLKHDVSGARVTSDKVIVALGKRDGKAAYKLGDKQFQTKNSAAALTALFKKEEIATLKAPTLDRQTVYNGKSGKTVFFIYEYNALKVPFYVRTGISNTSGSWKLANLSGSADESTLIIQ